MKTLYIKDLTKGLILSNETFALVSFEIAEDKSGKPYAKVTLADKTGKIDGKIWSDKLAAVERKDMKSGNIVMISGKIDEFRGTKQLTILEINRVDETRLEDFIESSDFSVDEMMTDLTARIEKMNDSQIKNVIKNILSDSEILRKFKFWPAARSLHHQFRSGLLQHVIEMITIADSMQKFYPRVNYDVLIAGIIMHDIGKIDELAVEGINIEYTKKGSLLGHITIGLQIFEKFARGNMSEDKLLHISHLILSHHGELEFGSPVVPATPEATMLSYIDNLSSKTKTHFAFVDQLQPDEFSNPVSWLKNARLWNVKRDENNDENPVVVEESIETPSDEIETSEPDESDVELSDDEMRLL